MCLCDRATPFLVNGALVLLGSEALLALFTSPLFLKLQCFLFTSRFGKSSGLQETATGVALSLQSRVGHWTMSCS